MYILPMPQKINFNSGSFVIKNNSKIILSNNCKIFENSYAKILKDSIYNELGFNLQIGKGNEEEHSIFMDIVDGKKESYTISVDTNGIKIIGGDTAGLLHGVQSLRQVISEYKVVLPLFDIEDRPDIAHRGFYYDVTRGRIPTLESLKKLVERASYYKINELQLYVEHSFLFKEFSEVWRDDTPITAEEILELDEYCQKLNIELIPSIATFGHLHKLLTTKQYKKYNEMDITGDEEFSYMDRMAHYTIDVSNDESIEIIRSMLNQYIPLFSSDKFNICADETFDLGEGKNKALAEKVGKDRLYVDFINKIFDIVKAHNKNPMFWGDIITKTPERLKELPKDIVCLTWGYDADITDKSPKKIYETNTKQYLCPGIQGWAEFMHVNIDAYNNITRMCDYANKYNAIGILNTDWGDFGHIGFMESSTVGMIYGSAFSWNNTNISFEDINKMISRIAYKDSSEKIIEIISNISVNQIFSWGKAVVYMEAFRKNNNEEMQKVLSKFDDTTDNNKEIEADILRLYNVLKDIEADKRYIVNSYLIMAKGIMLFNKLGNVLNNYGDINKYKLAEDMEYWWQEYKTLWRKDCKESELFRLEKYVFDYCDLLRD